MPDAFSHHPLFAMFQPFEGWVEPGFEVSHFGAMFRDWLFTGESAGVKERRRASVAYPELGDEYFEWIALLAAVATACGRFRMFELGAGWGRWSIYAAMLARQRNLPFHAVAVEPEPSHFEWLRMVFRDNGLDPAAHDLRRAVVGASPGPAVLADTAGPRNNYGQYVPDGVLGLLRGLRRRQKISIVKAVSLASLLQTDPHVDLIDMDIQGVEDKVMAGATAGLLRNVRVIHIGTHSHAVQARVRESFLGMGWLNAFSFPCLSECETPFGRVRFGDGVETWVNPEAEAALELMRMV